MSNASAVTDPFNIHVLSEEHVDLFVDHIARHLAESGQPGTPHFAPIDVASFQRDDPRGRTLARWQKPLTGTGWERAWGVFANEKVVGHLDLQCGHLTTAQHRVFLGMGLEAHARGKGFGRKLLSQALEWCAQQSGIDWMELRVFANNEPAIALYKSLGFNEDGRVPDMFRIHGTSIDDVYMSRRVR